MPSEVGHQNEGRKTIILPNGEKVPVLTPEHEPLNIKTLACTDACDTIALANAFDIPTAYVEIPTEVSFQQQPIDTTNIGLATIKANNPELKTAPLALGKVTRALEQSFASQGKDVFCVSITPEVSSTGWNTLEQGKKITPPNIRDKIHNVDSGSIFAGAGLVALRLEQFVNKGLSADEILQKIDEFKKGVYGVAFFDGMQRPAARMAGVNIPGIPRNIQMFVTSEGGKIHKGSFKLRRTSFGTQVGLALDDSRSPDKAEIEAFPFGEKGVKVVISHDGLDESSMTTLREKIKQKYDLDDDEVIGVTMSKAAAVYLDTSKPGDERRNFAIFFNAPKRNFKKKG